MLLHPFFYQPLGAAIKALFARKAPQEYISVAKVGDVVFNRYYGAAQVLDYPHLIGRPNFLKGSLRRPQLRKFAYAVQFGKAVHPLKTPKEFACETTVIEPGDRLWVEFSDAPFRVISVRGFDDIRVTPEKRPRQAYVVRIHAEKIIAVSKGTRPNRLRHDTVVDSIHGPCLYKKMAGFERAMVSYDTPRDGPFLTSLRFSDLTFNRLEKHPK